MVLRKVQQCVNSRVASQVLTASSPAAWPGMSRSYHQTSPAGNRGVPGDPGPEAGAAGLARPGDPGQRC